MAKRHAIDQLRRRRTERAVQEKSAQVAPVVAVELPDVDVARVDDDLLALVICCCHPALPVEGRVALTLRTVLGLPVSAIARGLGVAEPTVSQRITRAKHKIGSAGIAMRMPGAHELPDRVGDVLAVAYLLFTEGHAVSDGAVLVRGDLCTEAIHLTRLVVSLAPDDPAPRDLLALLLLTDARRGARTDATGDLVPLEEQDRSQWDAAALTEGLRLLESTARYPRTRYRARADVAACHARASRTEDTDWPVIVEHYERLLHEDE